MSIPDNFQIENGIVGVGRDSFFEIISTLSNIRSIRTLCGLSEDVYKSTKHKRFWRHVQSVSHLNLTPVNHPDRPDRVTFVLKESQSKSIEGKHEEEENKHIPPLQKRVLFIWKNSRGFAILDHNIEEGIWRLDIVCSLLHHDVFYAGEKIGIIHTSNAYPNGNLTFRFSYCAYNSDGKCYQNGDSYGNAKWQTGDMVSLEVNADGDENSQDEVQPDERERKDRNNQSSHGSSLHFLVNNVLQPVSYTNIPKSFKFYIEADSRDTVFEVKTWRRLGASSFSSPTSSPLPSVSPRNLPSLSSSCSYSSSWSSSSSSLSSSSQSFSSLPGPEVQSSPSFSPYADVFFSPHHHDSLPIFSLPSSSYLSLPNLNTSLYSSAFSSSSSGLYGDSNANSVIPLGLGKDVRRRIVEWNYTVMYKDR